VTGQPERYGNLPVGTKATELPEPQPGNAFLVAFGEPMRQSSCACERQSQPSLTEALQLSNGQVVETRLNNGVGQLIPAAVAQKKSDDEILEELYLAALCRRPREIEQQRAKAYIAAHPDRTAALEDIAWSVLNLREFVFRH